MKNIHILPTDKPSRIFKGGDNLLFSIINKVRNNNEGFHIYITSDEEIKEEDWFALDMSHSSTLPDEIHQMGSDNWSKTGGIHFCEGNSWIKSCKKIILTTDQDLIKDGVQAIDDEFLEWFVKNPSCEEVEIKPLLSNNGRALFGYKIIIPKEEPKFENSIENSINVMSIANSMFGKKEEPKQDLRKYPLTPDECFKQETLEEITEQIQKDCHKFVESIISKVTYQDATNTFLFMKLAELTLKLKKYEK